MTRKVRNLWEKKFTFLAKQKEKPVLNEGGKNT